MTEPYTPLWNSVGSWVATSLSRVMAIYAIVQGISIVLFSEKRWSAPVFSTANQMWGAPDSWGVFLFVAGFIALGGSLSHRMHLTALGHMMAAAWSLFFAITLAHASSQIPTAATTGVIVYAASAVAFVILGASAKKLDSIL